MANDIIQNVVYKTEKGTPVTDSVKVAGVFDKQHKNVLKSIRNLAAQNSAATKWFYETRYTRQSRQHSRKPCAWLQRNKNKSRNNNDFLKQRTNRLKNPRRVYCFPRRSKRRKHQS